MCHVISRFHFLIFCKSFLFFPFLIIKERPSIMPDRLSLLLCLTNPVFLNLHFVISQVLFHARAGYTQPHVDLPTLCLSMLLYKLPTPLFLCTGYSLYFPAVKPVPFLYRHQFKHTKYHSIYHEFCPNKSNLPSFSCA